MAKRILECLVVACFPQTEVFSNQRASRGNLPVDLPVTGPPSMDHELIRARLLQDMAGLFQFVWRLLQWRQLACCSLLALDISSLSNKQMNGCSSCAERGQ